MKCPNCKGIFKKMKTCRKCDGVGILKDSGSSFITKEIWFAWYPVKTDEGWIWWKNVIRITDDAPDYFMGMGERIEYKLEYAEVPPEM